MPLLVGVNILNKTYGQSRILLLRCIRRCMPDWPWVHYQKQNHKQINWTIILLKYILSNQGSFFAEKICQIKKKINIKSSQFSHRFTSKINLIKYKVFNLLNNTYNVPVVTVCHYLCSRFTYWSFLARSTFL